MSSVVPGLVGAVVELDVGAVAHGGHCVARYEGRVVFVRHALPGERVSARITEDRRGYLRADAVELKAAAAGRVQPPCPHAGAGRCGGCDWQHATPALQRQLKADVVREQFDRIAGLDVRGLLGEVIELPGGPLHWRTRVDYAVSPDGVVGLRRHRSHDIEPVTACPLGVADVDDPLALRRAVGSAPEITGVSGVRGDDGQVSVLAHRPGPGRQARGRRPPDRVERVLGPARLVHTVGSHELHARAEGFWQVHAAAAGAYAEAVIALLDLRPGEVVLELYAGAGALTVALADAVGPAGRVLALEASRSAVEDAVENLRAMPWVDVQRQRIDAGAIAALSIEPDVIVLDPPRAGAGIDAVRALLALRPRAIAYVACDPASLARDVAEAVAAGWQLRALQAFDAFPMTHHIECIALLVPPPGREPGTQTR